MAITTDGGCPCLAIITDRGGPTPALAWPAAALDALCGKEPQNCANCSELLCCHLMLMHRPSNGRSEPGQKAQEEAFRTPQLNPWPNEPHLRVGSESGFQE